ncbi:MAG: hypothetical protein BGO21_08600 [Dyadobacter sp. 50-39]|nr:MAG: hypothetical protein BGO21_08600 [Dyadobacter sp. 50-39]
MYNKTYALLSVKLIEAVTKLKNKVLKFAVENLVLTFVYKQQHSSEYQLEVQVQSDTNHF